MKILLSKNIKTTLTTSFMSSLIYACTMPFMIIYLAKHTPTGTAGIIVILNVAVSFLAGIIGGYLADNHQRKRILFVFQTLYAVGLLTIVFNLSGLLAHINWLVVGYFICGAAYNFYTPAYSAVVLDSTTRENRKKVYQYEYWIFNLSMAIGASIGGFAFKNYLLPLFIGAVIMQLIVTLFLQMNLRYENKIMDRKDTKVIRHLFSTYAKVAKDRRWLMFVVGMALYQAAEFTMGTYTGVRLSKEFDMIHLFNIAIDGVRMLSVLQVINTLMVVFLTFLLTRITAGLKEKYVVFFGLLIYVTGYGVMATANSITLLVPIMVIVTIGELVATPLLSAREVDLIPDDKQASYLSFSGLSFQFAQLVAGFALTLGGFVSAFYISVYIIVLGVVGVLFVSISLYHRKHQKTNPEATSRI